MPLPFRNPISNDKPLSLDDLEAAPKPSLSLDDLEPAPKLSLNDLEPAPERGILSRALDLYPGGKTPSGIPIKGPELMKVPGVESLGESIRNKGINTGNYWGGFLGSILGDVVGGAATGFDPRTAIPGHISPVEELRPKDIQLSKQKLLPAATTNLESTTGIPTGEITPKEYQLPPSSGSHEVYTGTGQTVEPTHPNSMMPASEIAKPTPKPVEVATKSDIPEIKEAAQQVEKSSWMDRVRNRKDPFTMSAEEQLNRQGPAGQVLSDKLARASAKERMYKSQWLSEAPTIENLSKSEFENAVDTIEGKAKPNTPEITQAAQEMSTVLNKAGQGLTDSGITLKNLSGESVPFQTRENYFPHYYPEGFWDKPDILDTLVKNGMTRDEALLAVQNRRKYGELLSSFQHQRIPTDLEGYLKSKEAFEQYVNTAARRLSMAEELGPEDLTGKPLSDLIEQTRDPTYTTKVLKRVIPGRDEPLSVTEEAIRPINNMATKLMAYSHLSRYAISRVAPSVEMITRGGARNYLSEMAKVLIDSGYAKDIQNSSGVVENISNAMLDAVNKYPRNFLFGKTVDDFMRTVAGGMGRGVAEDLFTKLKSNPNDLNSIKRLQQLVLENPQEVLKQGTLSKAQLNMASARFSELTQGLPENRKIPLVMSEPLAQIPLIMKKYAFQHGAMLKNAIMQSPNKTKSAALAFGLAQVFGEGIGDLKAGLKGIGSGATGGEGPVEKIAKRGSFESYLLKHTPFPDNPLISRMMDNFANAWIPFEIELLQSIGDKNGLVRAFGGPAIGDVSDIMGGGIKEVGKKIGQYFPVIGSR